MLSESPETRSVLLGDILHDHVCYESRASAHPFRVTLRYETRAALTDVVVKADQLARELAFCEHGGRCGQPAPLRAGKRQRCEPVFMMTQTRLPIARSTSSRGRMVDALLVQAMKRCKG